MARRKYNWEGLFDRPSTVLRRGHDYQCSQSTMSQSIRNRASMLGLRGIKLIDDGDTITVEVPSANPYPDTPPVAGQPEPPTLAPIG